MPIASISEQANEPVRIVNVGRGADALIETLRVMREIIKTSCKNYYVRRFAEKIVEGCPKCEAERVEKVYRFIIDNSTYLRDPHGFEFIKTPPVSLRLIESGETAQLDCDDYAVLSLSLLKSVGYPVALRGVSYRPNQRLTHVYGLVIVNGIWLPLDCVNRDAGLGWERRGVTKRMDLKI